MIIRAKYVIFFKLIFILLIFVSDAITLVIYNLNQITIDPIKIFLHSKKKKMERNHCLFVS